MSVVPPFWDWNSEYREVPIPELEAYQEDFVKEPAIFRNSKKESAGVLLIYGIIIVSMLVIALIKRVNPIEYLADLLANEPKAVLAFPGIFVILFLFILFNHLDRRPKLTVSTDGIFFKQRTFPWSTIKYLDVVSIIHKGWAFSTRPRFGPRHVLHLYDQKNRRYKFMLSGLDNTPNVIVIAISQFKAYHKCHQGPHAAN